MDEHSTALVRHSWKRVEPIAGPAATLFYENLFAADPSLAPLFKGDLTRQGERLMTMIGAAVDQLDDLPKLVPVLQALARRHVGYGVRDTHYRTVGDALLKTLGQGLGDAFTPEARAAWTQAYGLIAAVMVAAAQAPEATSAP